ncbi:MULTISPECIES: bifunctional diaminohydroxyphosphoribosylaminopyrimidine deaminase/5-amino-6-(5-phosphoribosylamino)uracil reductase RibD [unclassified Gordonia (in: high G+C Gram-positive bacteria)]|uniref:bifunctional diaminohydroxyphosphoribosylaminopyrimidine deaminase/5-amino-6-(5-phosphoribosylamino)uracil reductase RibD n=1 Tax=unclassified Gordonia (in: high G+C Gram-positive bacteria) TaxID=2657482 RepID=UPI001FFF90FE|nr:MULTISPECIES: bifunctional diaminohydroxyphosphoribosylaminopyrimidine deaminase/5-amino-6-(5-phosphoribosylamino)uracil reductase RibD [unclassified Gordonia (in: high G+C Gram-positive bacteria)]UQE73200.1 bifunctional diaminohydroxyphosphoribosylaminopyrimidine deaminase/5-amino-6-(5-phosphoribosylamino)uracil reductase RibD [Gordonia sp. PP30]
MSATAIERAMRLAIETSRGAQGFSSPNPPVGAVILDAEGGVAGVGHTQPPGGPHAEIVALRDAGRAARGGTAVVTLEPCNHTGRTGPCSEALIDAGVTAVHFGVSDPNPIAAGGAESLRAADVTVTGGVLSDEIRRGPLRPWLFRQAHGRPFVTAKIAATLDGRIAAPDGTSRWITGAQARAHAHTQRSRLDAIVIGTGTALADDPSLTARRPDGSLYAHQPTRVVVGQRDLPAGAKLLDDTAPLVQVRSYDPRDVLDAVPDALWVLVEGGPGILGAFLAAGVVDEVQYYLAPTILGDGSPAVLDRTVTTLTQAHRFRRESVTELGDDLLVTLTARNESE